MFDTSKLRGRIVELYGSMTAFSEKVGNSISFISQYMNGKKQLDQKTMDKWIIALSIPSDEIRAYFFTPKVHEIEQTEGDES